MAKKFNIRNITEFFRAASGERESKGGWRRIGANAAREVRSGTSAFKEDILHQMKENKTYSVEPTDATATQQTQKKDLPHSK
ncbi:sugar kinase [Sesbania bispinosa]|nr:sugar kinase [Sesbania bispinosa]